MKFLATFLLLAVNHSLAQDEQPLRVDEDSCRWSTGSSGFVADCFEDEVVFGSCDSGDGLECADDLNLFYSHTVLCCNLEDAPSVRVVDGCVDVFGDAGDEVECPTDADTDAGYETRYVVDVCASVTEEDACEDPADGQMYSHKIRCCRGQFSDLSSLLGLSQRCYWQYASGGGDRLTCNGSGEAVFGRCGSNDSPACGGATQHGIKCCPIASVR